MTSQKQLTRQIVELRVAMLYDPIPSLRDKLTDKIRVSIAEACVNGKIVKVTTSVRAHFVHKIEMYSLPVLTYSNGETEECVDLSQVTGAEIYESVK